VHNLTPYQILGIRKQNFRIRIFSNQHSAFRKILEKVVFLTALSLADRFPLHPKTEISGWKFSQESPRLWDFPPGKNSFLDFYKVVQILKLFKHRFIE